jgi:hypothetical protein
MSISSDKDTDSNNDINLFSTKEEEQQLEKLIKNILKYKPEHIEIWQKLSIDNKRELIITNNRREYPISAELNKHYQTQNNIKCTIIFNNNVEDIVYNYDMIIKELYKETHYKALLDKEVIEIFNYLFFD